MEKIKKYKIVYIIVCIAVVVLCVCVLFFVDKKEKGESEEIFLENYEQNANEEIKKDEVQAEEKNIYVHITGEVINPGVVIAKEGDRIQNVIEKAGGTTEKADLKGVNLAYKVEDGQKINIPNIDEEKKENNVQENNNNVKEDISESKNYITKSGGKNVIIDEEKSETDKKNQKVNINTATQTELETLNGIGSSTASKIIKYRNEKGKFKKIEDIKNVSGIGEAKFKKIEADIVV